MVTRITMACVLLFAGTGCATKTYTPILQYLVNPSIEVDNAAPTGQSLGVRPLETARPSQRRVAYTTDGHTLYHYPSAEWADAPQVVVTHAIIDALVAGGRFADVGNATDIRRQPDYILTGQLRAYHEDRSSGAPQALCAVRIEVRNSFTGEVWADNLTASAPLAASTPADLAAAMELAVAEIVQAAAAAITGL